MLRALGSFTQRQPQAVALQKHDHNTTCAPTKQNRHRLSIQETMDGKAGRDRLKRYLRAFFSFGRALHRTVPTRGVQTAIRKCLLETHERKRPFSRSGWC